MKTRILLLLLSINVCLYAQTFEERYKSFKQSAQDNYSDFRAKANAEYADFLRSSWEYYEILPAILRPEEKPVPPIIYDDKQHQEDEEIRGEQIPQPKPEPTPQPVAPIIENNKESKDVKLVYCGTQFSFRVPKNKSISLPNVNSQTLAAAWEELATDEYNNLIYDCLSARDQHKLCDWAYLSLLQQLSETLYPNSNAAVLLQAFIYANSGYQMRLAYTSNGRLHMLIGSSYTFYDCKYFILGGSKFFPTKKLDESITICNAAYSSEKPLSLLIAKEQMFTYAPVAMAERTSSKGVTATCSINKNLIDFYNSYPTGHYGNDFGTRWAAYADSPMDKTIMQELYPHFEPAIRDVSEEQAANILLNWVQTAFTYGYDDKIWGDDRAFFPAETLYYPYSDCEDRSIIFSRLVRDLLHLDVVLLYYPGHLATAVHFNQEVKGDYLMIDGRKFIVCDPTYRGAPVGRTMPDMDNSIAIIIPLR